MKLDFTDKVIIVTGGTRGIGNGIVTKLISLGAYVISTGTNNLEIIKLNKNAKLNGIKCEYYCVDFNSDKSLNIFLGEVKKLNKIDCLINNAGINILNSMGSIISDDMESMMKTNLIAPIKIMDSVIDSMKNNKCGKIVNISSIYGKISKEKRVLYTSTKYGINGLTVGASVELAKFNILVNSVSPGFVLTDLTKKNLTTIEINKLKKVIPIQRLANVEDIINPIIFLISDYNTYITGQNVIVDGGYTSI